MVDNKAALNLIQRAGQLKHLAGRHDQKSHGHGNGSSNEFSFGTVQDLTEGNITGKIFMHGTRAGEEISKEGFHTTREGGFGAAMGGIGLTSDFMEADNYAKSAYPDTGKPEVLLVKVSAKKPYVFSEENVFDEFGEDFLADLKSRQGGVLDMTAYLMSQGYDSAVVPSTLGTLGSGKPELVVFNPEDLAVVSSYTVKHLADKLSVPTAINPQWQSVTTYLGAAYSLKQDDKLPDYILALTKGTLAYEQAIKTAWIDFKRNPTEANAQKFASFLKTYSNKHWPEVVKAVLGVSTLSPQQQKMLEDALGEHHEYVMTSLLPDMLKAASADNLNAMDHRAIFLYAGALWSFGLLATVMFDGLEVRDLADLFLFAGPNDAATCKGERGCEQYAGKVFTVAQILADNIIPGRLRCVTNCRHMLLPVASPLNKPKVPKSAMDYGQWQSEFKHLAGRHDQKSHAGHRGEHRIATYAMTREEFENAFPVHSGQNVSEQELLANVRPGKGHSTVDRNLIERQLAALQHDEYARQLGAASSVSEVKSLVARQVALRQQYPNLSSVDLGYREVDVPGLYTDETLEANKKRFGGAESARVFVIDKPNKVLDVSTDPGFKELLGAKLEALDKGGSYPEQLKNVLLSKGYDAVRGGGIQATEKHELVFLKPVKVTTHRAEVERALAEGKQVPENVLVDYPDLVAEKHLPGEHDQKSHAPFRHQGVREGTSLTRKTLRKDYANIYSSLSETQQELVEDTLLRYGVTEEDLKDLNGITTAAPPGYHYDDGGYLVNPEGKKPAGTYNPVTKVIVLSAYHVTNRPEDAKKTLLHELGHHVTLRDYGTESWGKHRDTVAMKVQAELRTWHPTDIKFLNSMGLRQYSLWNSKEFLADTYLVMRAGTSGQRKALESVWAATSSDTPTLESIFKEIVDAKELQAVELSDGSFEFVWIDASVPSTSIDSIPWCYSSREETLKHLAGQHNQLDHGRKRAGEQRRLVDYLPDDYMGSPSGLSKPIKPFDRTYATNIVDAKAISAFMSGVNFVSTEGGWHVGKPDEFDESYDLRSVHLDIEERINWKKAVVADLTTATGMDYDRVNELVGTWAHTANDANPTSLGLQMAAHEEFGSPLTDWQQGKIDDFIYGKMQAGDGKVIQGPTPYLDTYEAARKDGRKLLRAMYDKTQQELKDAGLDTVLLYGGTVKVGKVGPDLYSPEELSENAMESWSLSYGTAENFSGNYNHNAPSGMNEYGIVHQAVIPRERILCTPKTGMGCLSEFEVIVLGSDTKDEARVVRSFVSGK